VRVSKRQDNEIPEGESYYVSMTDMMVGVVFIFILLLSFFALQYHATTSALTKASDPQTTALLQMASNLQSKTVDLQIDYDNKVVCIPTAALAKDDAAASTDKRCFAYSALAKASKASGPSADESREALTAFLKGDLASKIPVQADTANGTLTFTADDLFLPGSDALSPKGVTTASDVAQSLAGRLPCYGYGAPTGACASPSKMAAVNVAGDASFNAFSAEGQQAYDLALRRTVAFYRALIADQPILGQIKDGPLDGAQPLLRVASGGQSKAATASSTAEQSISIQFVMAS
jgi:hypothetical protein